MSNDDFPLGTSLIAPRPPPQAEQTEHPGILIVDDNEDNRYVLERLLKADGHTRVSTVSGGKEAIEKLHSESYALVLLDLLMPDMNGDEVLNVIKGNPAMRDTAVIILSSESDTERVSRCIQLGAEDYLPKPFNPTILRARIAAALRRVSLHALETEYVAKVEQQKRFSEELLRNILPSEIARRLQNGESNIADYFEDATVILSDVVGFGKITARMKAYEIVGCLNRLFSEFDRAADEHDVEKIKTVGDSYLAVAGVPTPRRDHVRAGVRFALEIAAATERLKMSLPIPFDIRVGVHCGPLVAGVIGIRKFGYDIWGDTVNVTARLEAGSQPNRVLVSAAVAERMRSEFTLDGPHKIGDKEGRNLEAFFVSPKS
jgi:adenylate cyclase